MKSRKLEFGGFLLFSKGWPSAYPGLTISQVEGSYTYLTKLVVHILEYTLKLFDFLP